MVTKTLDTVVENTKNICEEIKRMCDEIKAISSKIAEELQDINKKQDHLILSLKEDYYGGGLKQVYDDEGDYLRTYKGN